MKLRVLAEEIGKYYYIDKNKDDIKYYVADATGFALRDIYNLNWRRGTEIRINLM